MNRHWIVASIVVATSVLPLGPADATVLATGKVTTDFTGGTDTAQAIAVQPDGKIVVVGGSSRHFAIARYNPNGSLDATFGQGGRVTTAISGSNRMPNAVARAVAIAPDGRIIAAGSRRSGGLMIPSSPFVVVRYNPDGTLDTSFSGDGIVTTWFRTGGDPVDFAEDVALQPDGRIVAVGYSSARTFFAVARYNADGSADTSFDGDGLATACCGAAAAMIPQPDGGFVAVGTVGADVGLARFTATGALDNGFGSGGMVRTDFSGADDIGRAAASQSDGRIIAAGYAPLNIGANFALARYTTNGTLDTAFGQGGRVITDFPDSDDRLNGVVVQSDDRIVAAGWTGGDFNNRISGNFGLVRYNPNGSLDTAFGRGGRVSTDFANTFDAATAMVLQPDGKIIVVGETDNASVDFAIARYNPNGTLDTTFG